MITIAALVLFKLAEDGLEHARFESSIDGVNAGQRSYLLQWFNKFVGIFEKIISRFNRLIAPILKYILPDLRIRAGASLQFWPLFGLSFTVPFILGLDDFAGYVPLFNIINVFGFGIGVFVGHMILNMLLYISPDSTIRAVKNPFISFVGSIAFVGLGIWGLVEVARLIGI